MKFKIGDTVEVVGMNNPDGTALLDDFRKGHRGKITLYDRDDQPFPYLVKRKNGKQSQFNVKELKLIRKGNKCH